MEIILISSSTKKDLGPKIIAKSLLNFHKVKIFYRDEKNLIEKCKNSGLIVISANQQTSETASKMISYLKFLKKPIAYAGTYPSLFPEKAIKETDLVIVKNPAQTILELANRLENFQKINDVKNLWFKVTEKELIKN